MSFYSDASLVMIPSGYKTSKVYSAVPTDGTGDLTFTRSNDTATRVNSAGLIEKVRTNLILQSNSFNTTWTLSNSTMTSGQAGYDGTTNAWLYQSTSTFVRAIQNYSLTGVSSFSVYAKAGTSSFLFIEQLGTTAQAWFNLSTGALGSTTGSVISSSITSVGGGWYRCVMSSTQSAGGELRIRMSDANLSSVTTAASNIYIQDAQLETGDIATAYIATTTAAVSVGPVANVPRLDYLNSSCPRLLLEPQRQNVITFSEQMGNAAWIKTNTIITANATTAPDGYLGACKSVPAVGQLGVLQQNHNITAGQANTISIFAKAGEWSLITLNSRDNASAANAAEITFNLSTGVIYNAASSTGAYSAASGTITNYGNGWYRLTLTHTSSISTTTRIRFIPSVLGDGTKGLFVWGAQLETNASYASSYVNTLGAAVTRGADDPSKTGISSLIGSEAGTMYLEFSALANDLTERRIAVSNGTTANVARIGYTNISNRITAVLFNGTNQCVLAYDGADITQTTKVAFTWSVNDFALFVNGVNRSSDNSGTTFAANTLSQLQFDRGDGGPDPYFGKIDELLLFKSRLSDTDLAALTTL